MAEGQSRGIPGLLILATCWLLSPLLSASQSSRLAMTKDYVPRQYTMEHGLPDKEVRDILQSRDGYLWILTQWGLARFDGSRFVVFRNAEYPELNEEACLSLAEDTDGSLWIGARDQLLKMDGNQFRRWPRVRDGRDNHIPRIIPTRKGGVWNGSLGFVTHVSETNPTTFAQENGLHPSHPVLALHEDGAGVLWAGTFGGLYRLDVESKSFEAANPAAVWRHPLAVAALHNSADQTLWAIFAEMDQSILAYGTNALLGRRQLGQWEYFPKKRTFDFNVSAVSSFIFEDSTGNVWTSASRGFVHRLRAGRFDAIDAIPGRNDNVQAIHEDHEGNLWMGTGASGLWRWQPRKIKTYSTDVGLPHSNAWAVCSGPDGAVWMGTDGGVSRLTDGRLHTWTEADGLIRNNIRALAADREGVVWIGTSAGLNSLRDGKLVQHPFPGEWFEGKIRCLLPTSDGALWIAAATGLNRLHGDTQIKLTTAEGLAHNDVRALLEDSAGRLWIGTFGGGLQSYHDGRFTSYTTNQGLSSGFVWALHEDADGTLWVGTASGLNRLRDEQFATLGTGHGLPDNLVNFILEDDLEQLWISHDRGIYRARRSDLNDVADGRADQVQCVSYSEADGLPSPETNGQKSYPAGCKTSDGRLWFPTTRGVAVFDPNLHHEEKSPPRAVIEQVRATGDLIHDINPRDPFAARSKTHVTRRGDEFQLPPGSGRVLEFDYTANIFVNAGQARFRYRLLGMDEKWIEAGTRREAVFTNLKPGRYRFQVIAANHHGVWSEAGAMFAFRVAPFIYQTWWFYLFTGSGTAGLVVLIVLWRIRELRRFHRLEQQSAIAAERARIAKDLHDGLGADLTQLSLLADLADQDTLDSTTPRLHRRTFSSATKEVTQALKDIIWSANPADATLEGVITHVCQYAENYLGATQIGCRFDVPEQLPERVLSSDERQNLFLVAKEALANVTKHANATEVRIRVSVQNGLIALTIEDNGQGFGNSHSETGSSGRGLSNMRERMESMRGHFRVESTLERGTTVHLELPT